MTIATGLCPVRSIIRANDDSYTSPTFSPEDARSD
jgi:hypothetical protein